MEKNKLLLTLTIIATIVFGCLLANTLFKKDEISQISFFQICLKKDEISKTNFFQSCVQICLLQMSSPSYGYCEDLKYLKECEYYLKRYGIWPPDIMSSVICTPYRNLVTLKKRIEDVEKLCQEEQKKEEQIAQIKCTNDCSNSITQTCKSYIHRTYIYTALFFISLVIALYIIYQLKKTKGKED